ncbi:lipopolysaccharide biosynthesis protein [Myroides sp. ZB35]|uniref:lipopolysaccharide biosynthesis protein n=1 Tax=Myroides sp. ZB35 TaxID=1458492 RepID=UPI0008F5179B|nr:lipopolysaccharide biosynthesis protein [Myroides sp. ZB35]APA93625.1 lipopolysaccharide biosynthesis protein [Myroides sp. ZB35]
MNENLKKQAVNGVVWTFAQQFSIQLINFIVQIFLARMLLPEMFGMIAMLSIFIAVGQVLMDGGMTSSLIRLKEPTQLDYSTVFMTNLMMSLGIYILVFFSAPFIADFYQLEPLKNIVRIYALTFVIRAFVAVHVAKLTKEMNFKLQMKLQVPSTILGAIVGLTLAYFGYGVWSLVWLNISQVLMFTIQNWILIKWKPSFSFDKATFRHHFDFGYKMTLSAILDTIYNNSYNIVIGKFFSPAIVGFYNQADNLRLLPVNQISTVMGKVTYPLFSNLSNDIELKKAYKASMRLVLVVVIPIMILLLVIAEVFFRFLFGDKWLPAVPYFQVLAIASIFRPIGTYNLNILKVKGRSDLFLKLEIIKKTIGVLAIVCALPFGIMAMVYSLTITSILFAFLNAYFCGKLINYNVKQQVSHIYKLFAIGIISGALSYFVFGLIKSWEYDFVILIITSVVYCVLYFILIFFFEKEIMTTIKNLLKKTK